MFLLKSIHFYLQNMYLNNTYSKTQRYSAPHLVRGLKLEIGADLFCKVVRTTDY